MARVLDAYIDIDAPPKRVWEALIDFPSWKEWNKFIPSLAGKLEVGARLRITVHPPGRRPMKFKPEVFGLRPGEEILCGGSYSILFCADHEILLEPLPGGGTRFRQIERFRGPVVLFIGGLIKSSEKGYHEMNEALKRRIEGKI